MTGDHNRRDLEPAMGEIPLALVAAIPFVGSPLAQLIGGYRTAVQLRRLERFAESLGERIQELETAHVIDEEYAQSESYSLYVLRAAEIAATAHRDEHITLLARVAAGAAQEDVTDLWRDKFLTVANSIGPAHIEVLRALQPGEAWLRARDDIEGARTLPPSLPGFTPEEIELLLRDLSGVGLASDVGAGRYDVTTGELWATTPAGLRFMVFLGERATTA